MSFSNDMDEIAIANRKFAKTCVEKKRRDRINRCLDELKDLMSITDEKAKFQKLEKAEILEMAVNYMRQMQSQSLNNSTSSINNNNNSQVDPRMTSYMYNVAYRQAMNEFQSLLQIIPDINNDLKKKMINSMNQKFVENLSSLRRSTSSSSFDDELNQHKLPIKKQKLSHRFNPYSKKSPQKPLNNNDELSVSTTEQDSSSSSLFYTQNMKFGGSCSSLTDGGDSNQEAASCVNNLQTPSSSQQSSPASSNCSSPNTTNNSKESLSMMCDFSTASMMYANFELYQNALMKVWRPW
jgi:hypothetical protein